MSQPINIDFGAVAQRLALDFANENANLRIQIAILTAQVEQLRAQTTPAPDEPAAE